MAKTNNKFVVYYSEFKDKIFNYFLYRVGFERKLAEDLTSEVFIKAFKSFDDFDDTKSFQSWIFAISRNHLINHYKSFKRETSLEEAAEIAGNFHVKMDQALEIERVMGVIKDMDESDGEPLLMRYLEGLSNSEIAQVLEKDEGAVRTQISRGLAKLRKILHH